MLLFNVVHDHDFPTTFREPLAILSDICKVLGTTKTSLLQET